MKEKKVSQSATKIRIISCTAAPCAPFRPQCVHSRPLLRSLSSPRGAPHPAAPHPRAFSSRHFPKAVHPSAKSMRKARGFSLFPSTFPRKTHLSKKRSCVLLAPFADGLTPTAEAQGKNFTSPRRKCAEMRTHSLFFIFCLLSMREKHAIFASKTCFINSAWQKRGRSSPFLVCPPECPDTSLPSL